MCANVAVTHHTDGITALSRVLRVHRVVRIVEGEILNKASLLLTYTFNQTLIHDDVYVSLLCSVRIATSFLV